MHRNACAWHVARAVDRAPWARHHGALDPAPQRSGQALSSGSPFG